MSRDAGPVKGGDSIIAFVDDPTGYKWEVIGSKGKPIPEPIAQVRPVKPPPAHVYAYAMTERERDTRLWSCCTAGGCCMHYSMRAHMSGICSDTGSMCFVHLPRPRAGLPNHSWPCVQVMLRVTDLDKSIKYYTEALGMQLLKKKDNKDYKYTLAFLGYGPEEENVVFELTYNW